MFTNILVPTDGTENSQPAIDRALAIADAFDATVHAFSVAPERAGETQRDQIRDDPDSQAREAVEALTDRVESTGLEVVASTARGTPHEEILRYTDEHPIDAIVMGTHGRTGLDRVLLGSVAEKTVRNAHVPVMTVPPAEAESSLRDR